jgi:hypothetical protein
MTPEGSVCGAFTSACSSVAPVSMHGATSAVPSGSCADYTKLTALRVLDACLSASSFKFVLKPLDWKLPQLSTPMVFH